MMAIAVHPKNHRRSRFLAAVLFSLLRQRTFMSRGRQCPVGETQIMAIAVQLKDPKMSHLVAVRLRLPLRRAVQPKDPKMPYPGAVIASQIHWGSRCERSGRLMVPVRCKRQQACAAFCFTRENIQCQRTCGSPVLLSLGTSSMSLLLSLKNTFCSNCRVSSR